MKKNILIATGNKHKKEKLSWIVEGYFDHIQFPQDVGISIDVEEDALTFKDNAAKKAIEFSNHYDGYVIATDGGLSIPALGSAWNGLYTKRFAGEGATDQERIKKLLDLMAPLQGGQRKMVWNEALAVAKGGNLLFSKQVDGVEGLAAEYFDPSKYKEGIWVCSIWFFPQWGKNFFDLNSEEVSAAEISWQKLREEAHIFFKTL